MIPTSLAASPKPGSLVVFFNSPDFFENKYAGSQTSLGPILHAISTEILKNPYQEFQFTKELFYTLSEKVVADHITVYEELQSIRTIKTSTKNDLLRKLSKGKEMIDASFRDKLDVNMIARESGISEYHFFRLFKRVYGISPYQLLIRNRLNHSAEMINTSRYSIPDIALLSGFSDIQNFNKSFKKHFGRAPSSTS